VSDSIWKKEISLRRKPAVEGDDASPEAPKAEKQSFLKKEISFSRKPKPDAELDEPKQSFLKKEISFSRKPKLEAELDAPKQSFWKKEISLSRPKRDTEVERLAQEAAQAVAVEASQFDVVPPTELAEAVVASMPAFEPLPEPVAPPVAVEPVVEQPWPLPELVAQPVVEDAAVETPVAEAWAAEPELPPAPEPPVTAPAYVSVPEPEPVAVHPPVALADLPPLPADDAAPGVPFWKRELSLSRSKAPKTPKTPKAEKTPRAKSEPGVPFWKKELSFGRRRTTGDALADEPTVSLPAAQSVPFWKRSVALPKPGLPSGRGRHRAQKVVGLKIGASQLAAARVSNNGVAELQQVAREPLAPGVVVGGELRDPEALGDALKLFFARNKLPKKGVRLGIASNRIGVRILDIVGVEEDKQLANAVQFRAQEALPIPLDEALLDYRVLDSSVDEQGRTVKRVLLVVAYRELVERYIGACRKAGIALEGIDLEAFALLRALGAPTERGSSALVAIAIGHDRSTFAVSDGRICEFTRVVEWGGSALNVALARVFDSTPSEVEELKESLSLEAGWVPDDLTPEQTAAALDAVRKQIQTFARELVSSLQFYQAQPGSLGIGEIVITGGTAELPGLADELERLIGVRVRVGNPLARLKLAKRLSTTDRMGSLAVAIGLGIED
jgi:type IV pilus assembly protein PilM